MIVDITCCTDRFNLSVPGADFVNDCCYGEDFSKWLVAALSNIGVEADLVCMEDFGWANQASYRGVDYLMCVAGNSEEDPARPDYGTWHVMLERSRTLKEKFLGKNKTSRTTPFAARLCKCWNKRVSNRSRSSAK